jgi:hypothetical protein
MAHTILLLGSFPERIGHTIPQLALEIAITNVSINMIEQPVGANFQDNPFSRGSAKQIDTAE